jgi:hypothetical protein
MSKFVSCEDGSVVFRFRGSTIPTSTGYTYYIDGNSEFVGCATIVPNDGLGVLYNSNGVTFTLVKDCADPICPRTEQSAAVLSKCDTGVVYYFNVDKDTAFVGGAYLYSGECYSFVRFDGPGGHYLGSPKYLDCDSCEPTPTPTSTPLPTPTITPSVSTTPSVCEYTDFCFRTTLSYLSDYNGNYSSTNLNYNSRLYYTGNGTTYGVIYHTGNEWCLSDGLGNPCLLKGKYPCYSACPDLSSNVFNGGICTTPTPTPINCDELDFFGYFDCAITPTPTAAINCNNVDFNFTYQAITPTPSNTPVYSVGVEFSIFNTTPTATTSLTPTTTPSPTNKIDIQGKATYIMMDPPFGCQSVKVLENCVNQAEYYTSDNLLYNSAPLVLGQIFLGTITNSTLNNIDVCLKYVRDDFNISSNSNISQVRSLYGDCQTCIQNNITPTPTNTPTTTPTPTNTQTPTNSMTPSNTETPTNTPTNTTTNTSTPTNTTTNTPTPTNTQTQTTTLTPTNTQTMMETATPTNTPTITDTPTNTPTNTTTPTNTPTITDTPTSTPTITPTNTMTPTNTATLTQTATMTPTKTVTPTQTSVIMCFSYSTNGGETFLNTTLSQQSTLFNGKPYFLLPIVYYGGPTDTFILFSTVDSTWFWSFELGNIDF